MLNLKICDKIISKFVFIAFLIFFSQDLNILLYKKKQKNKTTYVYCTLHIYINIYLKIQIKNNKKLKAKKKKTNKQIIN